MISGSSLKKIPDAESIGTAFFFFNDCRLQSSFACQRLVSDITGRNIQKGPGFEPSRAHRKNQGHPLFPLSRHLIHTIVAHDHRLKYTPAKEDQSYFCILLSHSNAERFLQTVSLKY